MKKHPYYNYDSLLSYNATYNFLVGGRGLGKTYGAKKKVIRDYLKDGSQFVYLRRYKTELATARNTFFADIESEFPGCDFRVKDGQAQVAPVETRDDKKRVWGVMGFFISLSTAQNQKSVAFPKVTKIIFDEFIIETGAMHYLPDESTIFNNFYSTIDRWQDKTKVLFLANSVSIMNPYFIAYEIRPDEKSEFVKKADGFLLAHFPDAANFASSVFVTKFGKFIKDTDYADYAVGNVFSDNTEAMLGGKDSKARYLFTLEASHGSFSVWMNMFDGEYFVQSKLPKVQDIFTLIPSKMDTHKTLMTFSDRPLAYMRTAFRQGKVSFDKPSTRNTFADIFKR